MWEDYPLWLIITEWVIGLIAVVSYWKLYQKANKPGWAAITPIYGAMVMCQIAGKPAWWVIMLFIPILNIIVAFAVLIDFLKNFGKGWGYFFGMLFLPFIFLPILAFGKAQYIGMSAPTTPMPPVNPPVNPSAPTPGQ